MSAVTKRLAPVDEANLTLDHAGQVNVFLVAGVLGPGGFVAHDGLPDLSALRTAVSGRILSLPELRLVAIADGRRHRWAPSPPDLKHHVRLVAGVDGLEGLERLCGELMSTPLPLERPLWELLVVPGVRAGMPGFVLRIHHAVADGMAAVAIAQHLFGPAEHVTVLRGTATAAPPAIELRRDPRRVLRALLVGLQRIRLTLFGRQVGSTVLLGQRSERRAVAFVDVDLAALAAEVRPRGATVNDALLAAVASGYRAALPAVGEPIPARLPISVPVALKRRGTSGNQVGVMLVQLPLGEPDPDERLRLIAVQTRAEKGRAREQGTLELMRGPIGARIMDRVAQRQHLVAGFVTNVPGPTREQQLAGAGVAAIWPVAVLAANVRLNVAAISYAGRLSCGIHFDSANVPGDVFRRGMSDELSRLCE